MQGATIPSDVEQLGDSGDGNGSPKSENQDQLVREVQETIDRSDCQESGISHQSDCAHGYRCAPDRLSVRRVDGDFIRPISTASPDRPSLA